MRAAPLVALFIGSFVPTAAAAEKVAVFPFEGFALPPAVEMAPVGLTKMVSDRFAAEGYRVEEPVLLLRDAMAAVGCEDMNPACARSLCELLEASRLVVGKLERADGDVRVRIRIMRADGTLEREVDRRVGGTVADLTAAFPGLAEETVRGPAASADGTAASAGTAGAGAEAGPGAGTAGSGGAGTTVLPGSPRGSGRGGLLRVVPGAAVALAGGALLGVAAFTGARMQSVFDELRASPVETIDDFEAAGALDARRRKLATATIGLLIGGSLAVAAGAALVVWSARPGRARASVGLSAGPGGVEIRLAVVAP